MIETDFTELARDFVVKQVFRNKSKTEAEYINSAMDRAYLDFSRTMHGYSMAHNQSLHNDMKNVILVTVNDFRTCEYDQTKFDEKHSECCNVLIDTFKKYISSENPKLSYGQSQKWLNMTLKYLITLTIVCPTLKDIETNCKWFHVPIDGYVLKAINLKLPQSWSRMDKDNYFKCQDVFKIMYPNQIPIEAEFKLWNEYVNPPAISPMSKSFIYQHH